MSSRVIGSICVAGVGGVGGFFGGLLAASGAARVGFLARGEHLASIQRQGLTLDSAVAGNLVCRPNMAAAHLAEMGEADLYLVAVKGYDLDGLSRSLAPLVSEDTIILPLLNGVDIGERMRRHIPNGLILPACVYIGSRIEAPGHVVHVGGPGLLHFGPDPARPDMDPRPLLSLFERAGISCEWHEDAAAAVWTKYVFIAAYGLVSAASGLSLGEIRADSGLNARTEAVMEEIAALAAKRGIDLPADIVAASLRKADDFPPETTTSYQRDVAAKKAADEGDLFGGTILRLGEELGVDVPATRALYDDILTLRCS
jgi:2-dehydropantoate 2-reductase